MKVLYADDDIQVRDYVSMLLEAGLDCEILEASSGNEALSILEFDNEIDFVITEVMMKGGNGSVIVDYLDEQKLHIPIVWLSEHGNKEVMVVQEVLARSPLNAFVDKPFRDDQFFPVIDRIIELKEQGHGAPSSDDLGKGEDEDEDVDFDDDDFSFEDDDFCFTKEEGADPSSGGTSKSRDKNESEEKKSGNDDDWSYGLKKKKSSGEEEAGYSLGVHSKNHEEVDAGYSLGLKKKNGEEGEAGYSLGLKSKNHEEEDAGYSLRQEFNGNEEEAGYSLKKEFNSSEEEAGYSLKNEFNSNEEDAGYSLKKEFYSNEEEAGYSLKKEFNSSEEELNYDKEAKEKREGVKRVAEEKASDPEDEYDKGRFRRIKIKRFLNFQNVCCDIYIKIGKTKYIKLINANETYETGKVEKYMDKGSKFLFIENEHYEDFSNQFGELVLKRLSASQQMSDEIKSVAELAAFEHTLSCAREFGVTKVTADKVKKSVEANLKSLQKMPNIGELLKRIMRGGDYISEHSLMVSYFAGQICMATSWGNPQTLEKLSMAALMHDIGLESNKLAKVHTLEQAKEMGLSEKEIELIKSHPGQAAKIISEGENVFADVDAIIMQHHELPDKNGFPRGLGALSISPLSCIFIIASEFVEEIYNKDPNKIDMENIKSKFSEKFNKGNFKKPLEAFLKVF